MFKIKKKHKLILILLYSFFAVIFAYFVEHILGHKPCNLCLLERIPYILSIILITLNIKFKEYEKILLFLLCVIFLTSTILSFYHFGIEQGFFKESIVCELNSQNITLNAEDILKELNEKIISCKDISFRIFGFSLATLNTIISFIISVIVMKMFLNYEKN